MNPFLRRFVPKKKALGKFVFTHNLSGCNPPCTDDLIFSKVFIPSSSKICQRSSLSAMVFSKKIMPDPSNPWELLQRAWRDQKNQAEQKRKDLHLRERTPSTSRRSMADGQLQSKHLHYTLSRTNDRQVCDGPKRIPKNCLLVARRQVRVLSCLIRILCHYASQPPSFGSRFGFRSPPNNDASMGGREARLWSPGQPCCIDFLNHHSAQDLQKFPRGNWHPVRSLQMWFNYPHG